MRDTFAFIQHFLADPVRIGAIAPSSRRLAERMVADMGLEEATTVVELGPGTGAFTRLIAQRKNPDALFIAVEIKPELAKRLEGQIEGVEIINDSAEHLQSLLEERDRHEADAILCGLPWTVFPDDLQHRLMGGVLATLRPGGRFATFTYIHSTLFPSARRYRRMLENHFSSVETTKVVWANFPPAFVYRCEK